MKFAEWGVLPPCLGFPVRCTQWCPARVYNMHACNLGMAQVERAFNTAFGEVALNVATEHLQQDISLFLSQM